jgi:beta-glucosidase
VEVVQAYVAPPAGPRFRPHRELKAFAKAAVAAGATETVELRFDDRSFAAWEPAESGWVVDPGAYEVHVGRSSVDLSHVVTVDVHAA